MLSPDLFSCQYKSGFLFDYLVMASSVSISSAPQPHIQLFNECFSNVWYVCVLALPLSLTFALFFYYKITHRGYTAESDIIDTD